MDKRRITSALFKRAKRRLVGGVDSPVRAFNYVGGEPLIIERGRGSRVWDHDGNEYIDYVNAWGSQILGHSRPEVIKSVKNIADAGFGFGTTHIKEIELAEEIQNAIPFAEKIRFVNSGTEAVMSAVRLARAYTGRDKIVKFENAYHGHADYLLVSGGSGLATLKIPGSAGIPKDFIKHTVTAPYGDYARLDKVFKTRGKEIAAVLVEPVGGNNGVVPPDIDFLKHIRFVTKKYGALLISDEVITGFRFNFGSFLFGAGIIPDIISLGKIIGGGLPVGAYGGGKKIMDNLAPLGDVYQASTFSGNPVVMQAGAAALAVLSKLKKGYSNLAELTKILSNSIESEATARGIGLKVSRFGSLFSFKFEKKDHFVRFYRSMLGRGVYFAPSEFEANFLSFAHTRKDIDKTIESARRALWKI